MAIGFLILSLIAGAAITYYFMSREQLAAANEETALATAKAETAQRQAAESQLKLLQTQLEPHMLFNTLANLRVLIGSNPVAATEMLDRLNAYLRATLSASRATTQTLETEFERLRDYLELIAVRMGPRLQYSLELSPELARLPVPTLLLQPLVENAIRHGLEPKIEGGRITVRARQALGQLTLEVQDSGIGLPGGRTVTEGFGLTQVRERLASAYGGAATLDLHADETQGTQVRITYPIAA
jgi:LytS/YehU family sensor histidine kinase